MQIDQHKIGADLIHEVATLKNWVSEVRSKGASLGFVPTMGALHEGHVSLVRQALQENDEVLVSIFVNPTQFNNSNDLATYPRTLEQDLAMLSDAGCRCVFSPSVDEVYPEPAPDEKRVYDLGGLDLYMEGAFRPGHFQGVAMVLERFFRWISPDRAYFGKKDFQQLKIVQHLVSQLELPITIVPVDTIRDADGLAKSSRNRLLSDEQRKDAAVLPEILHALPARVAAESPEEMKMYVSGQLKDGPVRLQYFEIVDADTLRPVSSWSQARHTQGCLAAYLGDIRLIDNISLT
ncbi:MAG: pantoate--beta-alanine ligase [Flavobacteriales bacterium]|nr:pantoate--beta-alanine ligase [Flavobacteriales bacterium]MCB9449749.1 pantoate--beta-alanine ligase [Flavobacteriales bacterium]